MMRNLAVGSAFLWAALLGCGDDEGEPKPNGTGGSGGMAGQGGTCEPQSCQDQGIDCGTANDGCGRTLRCGDACAAGGQGGEGGGCTPTTCVAEGKNCGSIPDGCGNEIECGNCESGECGTITPNVCDCPDEGELTSSTPRTARRARSSGFDGTTQEYSELYDITCQSVDDCAAPCLDRGGTTEMCEASECLAATAGNECLPAPIWTNLPSIQFEDTSTIDSIQLVLVAHPYHDVLLVDEFGLEVPEDATITGITVEVRKAGDEMVADQSVRIIKAGVLGNVERASSARWPEDLTWVSYGGPEDLWGEEWTPADLNSAEFGLGFSAQYTETAGNTRAYVDQVRVTAHYALPCE